MERIALSAERVSVTGALAGKVAHVLMIMDSLSRPGLPAIARMRDLSFASIYTKRSYNTGEQAIAKADLEAWLRQNAPHIQIDSP
jgi:hypothetical protein